ncbi:hypothetical protein E2C01_026716 [Portunus trituberculatus]|uniref:Uncharacterized protein n=1 Tax=Portunus trituberculatus TaxID=210409 RepID=A0A5B7EJ33_PORTR|nr:hypothetical protein [Portunus trituberculatus]
MMDRIREMSLDDFAVLGLKLQSLAILSHSVPGSILPMSNNLWNGTLEEKYQELLQQELLQQELAQQMLPQLQLLQLMGHQLLLLLVAH